ncbi:MAG: FAD-binding oxidoreductase [Methanobacteriota archaeon]
MVSDDATRHAYATDASPCYVRPRVVVRARSEQDVVTTMRVCGASRVPVTPRAAGTSLSGAAIGPGVVLDTRALADIVLFDDAASTVRVGPGVLLRELNAFLATKGFTFPLEPGSLEWCQIGGMVGHNASGYRSVKYGQTKDYVVGLRCVLADGTTIDAAELRIGSAAWQELVARVPALEAVRRTVAEHREAILASRRPVRKHACGYDLWAVAEGLGRGVFPVAALFVGSEGTLGVVTQVTLRVLRVPSGRVTLLVFLDRLADLGAVVRELLPLGPSAMEAVDGGSLDLVGRDAFRVPASARAMLLVEFDEGDLGSIARHVANGIGSRYALSRPVEVESDPERQAALWRARRALFPSLLKIPGRRRPWGFVEDAVVPVDRVPEFVRFLDGLTRKYGTVAGVYGHVGDGNTHYRPLVDPTDPEDFARMRALRAEFDDAVLDRFRGAPSAEHGLGRIRAGLLERTWGRVVADAMRGVKRAFDPEGLLNPGVLFSDAPWWETWAGLEARTPM